MEEYFNEARTLYECGVLPKEEYIQILKDIQNTGIIEVEAGRMETQGKLLKAIDLILKTI